MKQITKYATLLAALVGLLVMGCDSGNGGGNEPSSPLTVTGGTVISCDRTTKGSVEIPSDVTAIKGLRVQRVHGADGSHYSVRHQVCRAERVCRMLRSDGTVCRDEGAVGKTGGRYEECHRRLP